MVVEVVFSLNPSTFESACFDSYCLLSCFLSPLINIKKEQYFYRLRIQKRI